MPSPVVHAGLALLLAVGLLGAYYDREALGIVLLALLIPETDAVAGVIVEGAHRTLFHNLSLLAVLAIALLWDTRRESSWLRERFGAYGVRVAWVCLFVQAFVGVGLDWANVEGVNLLWPLHDQFFRLQGEAYLSSAKGLVQTFVEITTDPATGERSVDVGGGGTREEVHVANPVQPVEKPGADPGTGPVERRFPIAVQGWQLYLVVLGLFTVGARRLQSTSSDRHRNDWC